MLFLLSGCSDSDSDSGTTSASIPDTQTGLAVTGTGFTSLTLSRDVVDDAAGYTLYRSETVGYSEVYYGSAAGYLDDGLGLSFPTSWYTV